jgi:hypothetical protein
LADGRKRQEKGERIKVKGKKRGVREKGKRLKDFV